MDRGSRARLDVAGRRGIACAAVRREDIVKRAARIVVLASALVAGFAPAPALAAPPPSPGAADIGDPLFPGLGNGGYDVRHYTLSLRYGSTASAQAVPAVVTVRARATQALSRFDLDFSGDSVSSVEVDGAPAAFSRDGAELVVTPAHPI